MPDFLADLRAGEAEKTKEQLEEESILAQDDAIETIVRSANDPFGTVIATSLESAKINKKIVKKFIYTEEYDGEILRGRSIKSTNVESVLIDHKITDTEASVAEKRQIESIR